MRAILKRIKWRGIVTYAALIISLTFLTSCYDDYGLATEDYDVVVTNFDKSREEYFPKNKSFVLIDSVFHLIGEDEKDDISRKYDRTILNQIKENMLNYGYTEITNPSNENLPDVVLRAAVTTSKHAGAIWNPIYPGWGWGWGGWGYPWYPGGSVTYYTYETGSLIVDLTDTEDWDPNGGIEQDVKVLWQGLMNGLLQNSKSGTSGRITSSIDQMYKQSPYLNVK